MKLRVAKFFAAIPFLIFIFSGLTHAQSAAPTISSFTPTSGYAGSSITITGTNFTGASAVKFNGTNASSYSVTNDTTISAVVAGGTTSGPISVTANGATATSSTNLAISNGAVTFSTFQVCKADGTLCGSTVNVNYNESVLVKWAGSNLSWCWGYRWATLPVDPDGSGWVQPPDQTTVAGSAITGSMSLGPLTSGKTYSLNCGQPGRPAQLKTVTVTVGSQALAISDFTPTSGAADTNVVITGTAFTNIKFVRFGTNASCSGGKAAASYSVDGTTQITAVVKTGSVTGRICVKAGSTTVTSGNNFTITPQATFTFNPPAPNPINAGQSVTLSWAVNAQVTWCWGSGGKWGGGTWVQPPDQTHPGTGGNTTDSPTVTTSYTLTCGAPSNPRPSQNQTVTVTGQPPPPPPTGGLPYFKVNGGDIFTGGWFNADSYACSNDEPTYQSPSAWKTQNHDDGTKGDHAGGILTYGTAPNLGSSTNQAAFSLGGIINLSSSRFGFMTNTANSLAFANGGNAKIGLTAPNWGGFFEGDTKQTHCIPDYYNTKIDLPKAWHGDLNNLASGQYLVDGDGENPVLIKGVKIDTTQNVTLFVNGNAYISDDITYKMDKETINDIPKFALIVSGNIYIDPKVARIDGFYVAQPQSNDTCDDTAGTCHGKIFTCHANDSNPTPARDYVSKNCRRALTINGALVAADVEFNRVNGDITGAFDSNVPAETVNFIPEMTLGGSFFHGPSAATSNQSKIDSIISLPPIF